jgi:hypothetical protein
MAEREWVNHRPVWLAAALENPDPLMAGPVEYQNRRTKWLPQTASKSLTM